MSSLCVKLESSLCQADMVGLPRDLKLLFDLPLGRRDDVDISIAIPTSVNMDILEFPGTKCGVIETRLIRLEIRDGLLVAADSDANSVMHIRELAIASITYSQLEAERSAT